MSGEPDQGSETGGQPTEGENPALEDAMAFYQQEGLRLPPVPRELATQIEEQDESKWGTTDRDLTDRGGFLDLASDPATPDLVDFGYVGHGVSSWWMCYQLLLGPLAAFVRQGYGGPYRNAERARLAVNTTIRDLEALIVTAEAAPAGSRLAPGQRLLVVVDDRDGSGWGVLGGEERWQSTDEPLDDAIEFLNT